jgi:azurin
MEHNFVLGASGSLEQIGNAADQMSTTPAGLAQQYVPDIGQVLAATPLIKPGESFRLQFTAPTMVGQYPYLCTFPAHWRLMNGVLNVVMPAGRGRGAGAAPAPAPAAGAGGRIGG